MHALVGDSRMEDAIALLGDLTGPTHQDLGVPKLAISELEAAVAQSGQKKLSQAYKVGHYWGGGGHEWYWKEPVMICFPSCYLFHRTPWSVSGQLVN